MPQELGLNHLSDFSGILPQQLFLEIILLQSEKVLSNGFEPVHIVADVLELLENHSLLERVKGDL